MNIRQLLWLLCVSAASCATSTTPSTDPDAPLPFKVERFALPGPVAGVLARVDLADPRVRVKVALADDRDPDGAGPCVGQLDTTSNAARKNDFAITINASFFLAPNTRTLPEDGINTPAPTLTSVDLPQPVGPTTDTNSPGAIASVVSATAV